MNGKNCAMPHYRCQGDGHQGDSTSSLPAAGALCTAACGHGTPPSLCSTTTYIRTLWHGVGLTPKYGFVSPCPPAVWPSPSCCWALATPRASCCLTSAPRKTGLRGKWYEGNEGGGRWQEWEINDYLRQQKVTAEKEEECPSEVWKSTNVLL